MDHFTGSTVANALHSITIPATYDAYLSQTVNTPTNQALWITCQNEIREQQQTIKLLQQRLTVMEGMLYQLFGEDPGFQETLNYYAKQESFS